MIKFRAKDKDGNWVYGGYWEADSKHYIIPYNLIFRGEYLFYTIKVDPETVGQYIGRLDKNNKEIYNGDIVKAYITSEWDEDVPREEVAVVEWDGCKVWCKSTLTADWYEIDDFNWEVIGNTTENPELL